MRIIDPYRQWSLALLILGCTMLPGAASAQQDSASEAERPTAEAQIDPNLVAQEYASAARDDAHIATRLSARLSRNEDLKDVSANVSAGVVTLSGSVIDAEDRELAESIAASIEGVISVQQQIAINASLRDRVSPALEQSQEKLLRLGAALPLLLVAVVVILGFIWLGRWLAGRLHLLRWGSARLRRHTRHHTRSRIQGNRREPPRWHSPELASTVFARRSHYGE